MIPQICSQCFDDRCWNLYTMYLSTLYKIIKYCIYFCIINKLVPWIRCHNKGFLQVTNLKLIRLQQFIFISFFFWLRKKIWTIRSTPPKIGHLSLTSMNMFTRTIDKGIFIESIRSKYRRTSKRDTIL